MKTQLSFFFCDLLFSTKTHLSYGKEHSVQIEPSYLEYWLRKVMSNITFLVKLMVEINL